MTDGYFIFSDDPELAGLLEDLAWDEEYDEDGEYDEEEVELFAFDRWDINQRTYYLSYPNSMGYYYQPWEASIKSISGPEFVLEAGDLVNRVEAECKPAHFYHYLPHYRLMGYAQQHWYFYWRSQVRAQNYLSVGDTCLFLHVFELINGVGCASEADGLDQLLRLWHAYQSNSTAVRHLLWRWIEDYVLAHDLCSLEELYSGHAVAMRQAPFTNEMIEYYAGLPLNQMPFQMINQLGNAGLLELRVFQLGYGPYLEWFVPIALSLVNDQIRGKGTKGIFQRYGPRTTMENVRYVFTGALYGGPRLDVTVLPARPYLHSTSKINKIMKGVAKHTENQLRKMIPVPGRVGGYDLEAGHKALIEEMVKEQFPRVQAAIAAGQIDASTIPQLIAVPRASIRLDLAQIDMHGADADQIREMLLDGIDLEAGGIEFVQTAVDAPPELVEAEDVADGTPWEQFARQLSEPQWTLLIALAEGKVTSKLFSDLTRGTKVMPDELMDQLNDLAIDTVGDALFDSGQSPYHLYDEYQNDVVAVIAARKQEKG